MDSGKPTSEVEASEAFGIGRGPSYTAMEEPTMSIVAAGKALGLGRDSSYRAAKRGEIKVLQFGRLGRVPTAWLKKQLGIES